MAQTHFVRIRRNEFSFPLHLSHFATPQDVDAVFDTTQRAAQSPFGRDAVEFLNLQSATGYDGAEAVAIRMIFGMGHVADPAPNIKGVNWIRVSLIRSDSRLPRSYLETSELPLVAFSTPSPVCLLYAMALAGLRYPGMESAFAAWLQAETEGAMVKADELTEHDQWLHDQLKDIPEQPEVWLSVIATIFQRFVERIERLHVADVLGA